MKRKVLFYISLMAVVVSVAQAEITTVWNPAANTDPNTRSLWTIPANWTQGATGAPMTQDKDWKVVYNVANATECILDTQATIMQLVMGDGGTLTGNFLRLVNGAHLISGIRNDGTTNWTAVGYNRSSTLVIEAGAILETKTYMLVGRDGSDTTSPYPSYVFIDGGTALINGNFIMGNADATKSDGGAYVTVDGGGLLDVQQLSIVKTAIGGSRLNVMDGTVKVTGDIRPAAATMIADGRIAGYYGAAFDKTRNPDVTYLPSPANKTIITAVHPMEPTPVLHAYLPLGDVTLEWNNWDPNHAGASVVVDVWFGTDPNKMGPNYAKVVSARNVTGQARSSAVVNVSVPGTYYWQVDTNNGAVHEGDLFTFNPTNDTPPAVDAGPGFVTWVGRATQLDATIADEGINTPTLGWTYTPQDGNVAFSSTTVEDPVVTVNAVGTYTLTLTADDKVNSPVSDSMVLNVYADACQAARTGMGTVRNADLVVDCKINLTDLAVMANDWLLDYSLAVPAARY
jgi:hypothetical protein